jgi:cell division protein FtsX
MSNDPIKILTETLIQLRSEIADVKARQITEERLKHLESALEDNAEKIAGVQNAALRGSKEGASRLAHSLDQTARDMQGKVDDAVRSLSEARRAASDAVLARRRNVWLLMVFSALTGLATGALASVVVFDYYLGRDFADSVQLMGLDWACTRQDGFIADQQNGKFCVFQISE